MSILYSPFFFAAHFFAEKLGFTPNGFTEPYKLFLLLGTLFYAILGLIIVRNILRHYQFSEKVTAVTLLLLGLSTNLFCYATVQAPMSHAYSFFLIALYFYSVLKYRDSGKMSWMVLIAFAFSLITIVRPSNAVVILLFFFCKERGQAGWKPLKLTWKETFLFIVMTGLVWLPQMLYWKTTSGHWLVNSYGEEGFFFGQPKIYRGLFSFRKGWLIYTPVMIFALAGFAFRKRYAENWFGILLFTSINFYVIVSWWCWWYGGSLGLRPMIDSYGILSLPMAATIEYIFVRRWLLAGSLAIWIFTTWLNIFQTYQYEYGYIDPEGMNGRLYFRQFGKCERGQDFDELVSPVNADAAIKGIR